MSEGRKIRAALFDFDGVIADTEGQYSLFWNRMGQEYLGVDGLHVHIKGQTLTHILGTYFPGRPALWSEIEDRVNRFEEQMSFDYIAGIETFAADLRRAGVSMCIVTSSNHMKMSSALRVHPDLEQTFGPILTSEDFSRSKPDPDCFLVGMKRLGASPHETVIFEDSINGLRAAMASGATVIGLATTNSRDDIAPLCHKVIDDFRGLNYQSINQLRNNN